MEVECGAPAELGESPHEPVQLQAVLVPDGGVEQRAQLQLHLLALLKVQPVDQRVERDEPLELNREISGFRSYGTEFPMI